jgi:rhodanese-related sulfurtransferase
MRRALLELMVVTVVGVLVALTANLISPRGLSLTRNYFPAAANPSIGAGIANSVGPESKKEAPPNTMAVTKPKVNSQKSGALTLTTTQALELFHDPEYEQELIVFVDARDNRHYEEGHVPGAYQLDRYYPENHLPTVLPACLNATRVVVYCAGGECEDSHFAAQLLQEAGVPPERVSVYAGGITEWRLKGLPVETGARKSGTLRISNP